MAISLACLLNFKYGKLKDKQPGILASNIVL